MGGGAWDALLVFLEHIYRKTAELAPAFFIGRDA